MDLFSPVVAEERLSHNFLSMLAPSAAGMRAVLTDWANGFEDRGGEFIYQFQTTYNSAFWELYLFATLKLLNIEVNFSFHAPDFVCANQPIAMEATVASHAESAPINSERTVAIPQDKNLAVRRRASIIRLSNSLMRKSEAFKKRYAPLTHMAGRSYIVAIADFGMPDAYLKGDDPIQHLLFDVGGEKLIYKASGAQVPLGLFRSPEFSHISAVLYSSLATFGKAQALGTDAGDIIFRAVRKKENAEPLHFTAHKRDYKESLTDGLVLYTNPHASIPINLQLFADPGIRRCVADKKGSFDVSSHPDGDLYFRTVQHN